MPGAPPSRSLVLGGAGFIGYHLARRLLQEPDARVTVVDDFSRGRRDAELQALLGAPGVTLLEADLTRPAAWAAIPHQWDHVYMLAAVVGVRRVEGDPLRVLRVNTLAALNFVEWLAPEAGVVFFASTSEVYAGAVENGWAPVPTPEAVPLTIGDVQNPRFAYAVTKILGESAVIHGAAHAGVAFVVGRLHNVYGPRMGAEHVIPELCLRAQRREEPFRLFGADQRRAFCHVDDAVEAIRLLVRTPEAWGSIVNIGNDTEETKIADLARLVLRVAGFTPTLDTRPAPAGSVGRRCPDLTRLRALTGYAPKVDLEAGVRQTFAWYRERGEGHP